MNLLRTERDTLERYIPGLDKFLSEVPLLELAKPGNGALWQADFLRPSDDRPP